MKALLACGCTLLLTLSLTAQDKPFRWGTDPTGGAPFIYQTKSGDYTGFEWDMAQYLAAKLGRRSEMVSVTWPNLPAQLDKPADVDKGIDVVFNGYELRGDLARKYAASRAYYAYRIALIARKDDAAINDWDDVVNRRVGVLRGTVAHRYLLKMYPKAFVEANEDVANVIQLVNDKRLSATVQDSPAATYYLGEFPELQLVGEPVKSGYYVMYYRKSDVEFGKQLDAALRAGLTDGTFRAIYEKYGLWNEDQADVVPLLDVPWPPKLDDDAADWSRLLRDLVRAAGMTILLAVSSFPLAMLLGLLVAVGRVYGPTWLGIPLKLYVEIVRGTPLLLQLYALYYMVPGFFPDLAEYFTPLACGILGLAVNYSAYEAENYRAGLTAIPLGQMEAALALGMTRLTAIRRIVAPQAVRIVIPPVTNDFIALFKDTSICSVILITELTQQYNILYNFNRDIIVQLVFVTAGLYLSMSWPLGILAGRMERRFNAQAGGGR